jgi:hypothetical protein
LTARASRAGQRTFRKPTESGLQYGFQLGEWLIEPRERRVTRGATALVVPAGHMKVLM